MKQLLTILLIAFASMSGFAADLSITATALVPGANAKFLNGIAGATITAGQVVTVSTTNGRFILADANDPTLRNVAGIAAHGAASGQPLAIITEDDDLTLGATLSMVAPIYVLSGTAGGIAPTADIASGWFPIVIGVAKSTTKIIVKPRAIAGSAAAVGA